MSDTQRVKEETFIQTSRRGGNGHLGQRGLAASWQLEDCVREVAPGGAGSPILACGYTGRNK